MVAEFEANIKKWTDQYYMGTKDLRTRQCWFLDVGGVWRRCAAVYIFNRGRMGRIVADGR